MATHVFNVIPWVFFSLLNVSLIGTSLIKEENIRGANTPVLMPCFLSASQPEVTVRDGRIITCKREYFPQHEPLKTKHQLVKHRVLFKRIN